MRYWQSLLMILTVGLPLPVFAAGTPVQLYRNPNCGCCNMYANYLRANGFDVRLIDAFDMASIAKKFAIAEKLEGCHTAVIGGYIFEGLIPVEYVKRVLNEHRQIKGISLPGMPVGAPGMPGSKRGPLNVYYLSDSPSPQVFASF